MYTSKKVTTEEPEELCTFCFIYLNYDDDDNNNNKGVILVLNVVQTGNFLLDMCCKHIARKM